MNDGVFIPPLKVPVRQQWNENEDVAPCGAFCPKQILSLQTLGGQETGQLFIDECHKENSAKKCLRRRKNTDKSHFNEEPRQKMGPPVPRFVRSASWLIEDSPSFTMFTMLRVITGCVDGAECNNGQCVMFICL